jgi:hypothetical protein
MALALVHPKANKAAVSAPGRSFLFQPLSRD